MRLNIEKELTDRGCALSRGDFCDLVQEVSTLMYPDWTVDELACHPTEAHDYCEQVRLKASATIPDHVIMRTLMNARKRPDQE